jgi:PAS domain S-box-containing protein
MSGTANVAELLIQSITDYAIYMLDPAGRIMSWNPGARLINGYTAEEILGQNFSKFYTEEDRAAGAPANALKHAREHGRYHTEGWRVRKDGSRFWTLVAIDPIFLDGKLIGFAKITRDITSQRDAQLAALETESRFRLLVQGVSDYAIYMLSPEGRVTNWNTGAERIKGYTSVEIIGQHFSRFYTEEDFAAGVPDRALETARTQGRYEAEGWRARKDGTRFWAAVVIDAIRDEQGEIIGYAKVTRDLSERKAATEELEKAREQLFQAQKMEAVGQLTGGIAHDFNNILTGITGSLELIKQRMLQGRVREVDRYLAAAQGAASRAAALTHRLLAFARRQTLDPKIVDANVLVGEIEELVRRTIGPEIELKTALTAGLQTTSCDPNQLENAILNLCINARDAMPDGGSLTIATAVTTADKRAAAALDVPVGQYVTVAVTDTGSGMSPEVIGLAFDPFYTTKPTGEGTGLGLSMVYGFAKQSGGQTRIESEVGAGTTVRIYLPVHRGQSETVSEDVAVTPFPRAEAGGTVLVIDDEGTIRMLILDVLSDLGYATLEAADGSTGLKILQSNTSIDLLITDVGLPGGLNGRQLADLARLTRPQLKVLFITGYAEASLSRGGQLAPGMQVMSKPFTMDSLAARIKGILDAGTA